MKKFYLLLLAALVFALPQTTIHAQKTDNKKKVIIVTKSVDDNGETLIEKIIGEGDEAQNVLKEMALRQGDENVDIKVISTNRDDQSNELMERLFLIRSCDGKKVEGLVGNAELEDEEVIIEEIHGEHGELHVIKEKFNDGEGNVFVVKPGDGEHHVKVDIHEAHKDALKKIRIVTRSDDGEEHEIEWEGKGEIPSNVKAKLKELKERKFMKGEDIDIDFDFDYDFDYDFDFDFDYDFKNVFSHNYRGNSNCAALGVYVNTGYSNNLKILSLIGEGGAEKAGLEAGDKILAVDSYEVNDHSELMKALSYFRPGDQVDVTYERDETVGNMSVQLTSWKDLPSFKDSWRANVSCDEREEVVTRKIIIIKKKTEEPVVEEKAEEQPLDIRTFDNSLELNSYSAFPNPTAGKFRVRFEADAAPVTVKVLDASGKEVFSDSINDFGGSYDREVHLKGITTGNYILFIEQGEKIFTDQIIVNRV